MNMRESEFQEAWPPARLVVVADNAKSQRHPEAGSCRGGREKNTTFLATLLPFILRTAIAMVPDRRLYGSARYRIDRNRCRPGLIRIGGVHTTH